MRVIPCCPLPYSDGRFNELLAVRTICGLYHRRPRRLAEGLKRAESAPTGVALGRSGVRAKAAVPLRAWSTLRCPDHRLTDKTSRLRPRHVVAKPAQTYEPEVPETSIVGDRPATTGISAKVGHGAMWRF